MLAEIYAGEESCSRPEVHGSQDSGNSWIERLSDAIAQEITEEVFPNRRGSAPFHDGLQRFVRTSVLAVAMANGVLSHPDEYVDRSVRDFGVWVAEQGLPPASIRQVYWTCTRQLIDRWGEMGWPGLVSDQHTSDGRTGVSGEVVAQIALSTFEFAEHAMPASMQAYQEAVATHPINGDRRRRQVVQTILSADDDARPDPTWDAVLGYRLGGSHVGLLLDAADRAQATTALQRAQVATGAQEHLLLLPDMGQWRAWLGYHKAATAGTLDILCRTLQHEGLHTAVGRPRSGVQGFRATHRDAVRAAGIRGKIVAAPMCVAFQDVSLEDLLLHDPSLATAFVHDELGPLAKNTDRAARMRETLCVWLSCGTHTATAARLGIHENTVRLRLNAVSSQLGARYLERKTELLVALRLSSALAGFNP